jgi:hypothetical protein
MYVICVLEGKRMTEKKTRKRYKGYDNFYLNKDGSIRKHKSADGSASSIHGNLYIYMGQIYWGDGIPLNIPLNNNWDGSLQRVFTKDEFNKLKKKDEKDPCRAMPFRYNILWKCIFQCETTEELEILIELFKSQMVGLDKSKRDHQAYITEHRTAITMAKDYRNVLKHIRDTEADRYVGVPLINNIGDEDKDYEGSAFEETEADNVDVLKTSSKGEKKGIERLIEKFDPSIKAYYQLGLDGKAKLSAEGVEIVENHPQEEEFDFKEFPIWHRYVENKPPENKDGLNVRQLGFKR